MARMPKTRRGRRAAVVGSALAIFAAASLVPTMSGTAAGAEDRWSGRWDVEGTNTENGPFSRFGVLSLEIYTDGSLPHGESENCTDTDLRYVGTYPYGGGGTFEGCELSSLDYGLYGKYFDTDGTWGQAYMEFTPGSPAKFTGYYSPPTRGTAGLPATLKWRGTKLEECPAPEAGAARVAAAQSEEGCSLKQEVTFAFKHGGRNRNQPDRVKDMTTNGAGSLTFDGHCNQEGGFSGPYKDPDIRVVRTADIHDGDSPFVDEVKLVFKARPDGRVQCESPPPGGSEPYFSVSLRMVSSTDPSCREGKNGRGAILRLYENVNALELEVAGCPLHSEYFQDRSRAGKKPLVNIVMDFKTVSPN